MKKYHTINDLYASINSIEGVGKKCASLLNKINIYSKIDLLLHMPINLTSITYKNSLNEINTNEITTLPVTIKSYSYKEKKKGISNKKFFQVIAEDSKNNILLINFFNYYSIVYLKKLLPLKSTKNITGKFEIIGNHLTISHPEISNSHNITIKENIKERTYKTIKGLSSKRLSILINNILENAYELPEWLNSNFISNLQLPTFIQALKNIHSSNNFNLNINDKNLLRLSIDEMLAFQLKLIIAKNNESHHVGYIFNDNKNLIKTLYKNLPFQLTDNQKEVIKEIFYNLKSKKQMVRLLEGDVGSGKTIVALFCAILAVSSDYMAVLMVPTENLAQQHFNTFFSYTKNLGINLALLTGSTKSKERKEIIKNISNKKIDILIGTHATFQSDIIFNSLGLIIIDEQHRFGVMQRLKLINKDKKPHILMLSATPIPRTLALTNYGHIDISRILHKPQNRKPVITKAIDYRKINIILKRVINKVLENNKVFWICPLIEDSKKLDFTAALVRYNSLLKILPPNNVWLLHGKMPVKEKIEILQNFKNAIRGILVSTTVIEVGIDIPDANIIIIEHADRFGLAQLHQLRGRVGRGNLESYCLLIYNHNSSNTSKKRMQIMENSNDGFYIAEKDFELRGGGNILGIKQSGESPFKIASLELQNQYMKIISSYAKYLYIKEHEKFLEYYQILDKIFHFDVKNFSFTDVFNNG